jgi:O-methyltransferase
MLARPPATPKDAKLSGLRRFSARALRGVARLVDAPRPDLPRWTQMPFDPHTRALFSTIERRTMTNLERVDALRQAVEHVHANSIPGDIVECGVWRGGSMMAVALTLLRLSGPTAPGAEDTDYQGRPAADWMVEAAPASSWMWTENSVDDVRMAMAETGYPADQLEFVAGPVETTIPQRIPEHVSLLRLDTDWFESTYHELTHLWPRLARGGILIIDDYGDWAGSKKATDQYFAEAGLRPFLHRIDGGARLVIKP